MVVVVVFIVVVVVVFVVVVVVVVNDQSIIGKKVKVSLQLFDIFEKNMVFIFLLESWGSHPADCTLG